MFVLSTHLISRRRTEYEFLGPVNKLYGSLVFCKNTEGIRAVILPALLTVTRFEENRHLSRLI